MNPFEFESVSIHSLLLTENDQPALSIVGEDLVLNARRNGKQLVVQFPASVLLNFKGAEEIKPFVPKIRQVKPKVNRSVKDEKRTQWNLGENNPQHKLTTQDVIEIKRMTSCEDFGSRYETRFDLYRDIAIAYHVTPTHIYNISRGNRWGHVKI